MLGQVLLIMYNVSYSLINTTFVQQFRTSALEMPAPRTIKEAAKGLQSDLYQPCSGAQALAGQPAMQVT